MGPDQCPLLAEPPILIVQGRLGPQANSLCGSAVAAPVRVLNAGEACRLHDPPRHGHPDSKARRHCRDPDRRVACRLNRTTHRQRRDSVPAAIGSGRRQTPVARRCSGSQLSTLWRSCAGIPICKSLQRNAMGRRGSGLAYAQHGQRPPARRRLTGPETMLAAGEGGRAGGAPIAVAAMGGCARGRPGGSVQVPDQ